MKKILILLFLLLLTVNCFAVLEKGSVRVFAVTDNGRALQANLSLELKPGTGKVWTSIEPLVGTSTQSTEKIAVALAEDYSQETENFDYFFEIESDASLVEGPSAGSAMALLTISLLQEKRVPENVSLTGTITSNGGIGPVGGIFEKAKEAARVGVKLFMIPPGETRQTIKVGGDVQSINLLEYAQKNWGLKVVEVNNIDDALKYAFLDIETIDVNVSEATGREFVPDKIALPENLTPMKQLTERYIVEAKENVRSAKTALSGSLLDDPALIDAMLTSLNESEKTLEKSELLAEQNYLYSAANYAFLAIVNSNFVKDIAENPSILSSSSTDFENKVLDLKREMNSFAFDLNKYVPVDKFEWHVAAKERLVWAKRNINRLEKKEIVIVIEGSQINDQRIVDIMDYEYALAWYHVANDFFELTKESKKGVLTGPGLKDIANNYIVNTENSLSALSEEEISDITRRLDGAKLALDSSWSYSALFDASSALALTNSRIFAKNKSLEEIQSELDLKIAELETKLQTSAYEMAWAQLYLDHANYFLNSSLFYEAQGQTALALDNAKSGMDLIYLANGVFEAANASYTHFENLPAKKFITPMPQYHESATIESLLIALLLVALVLVFIIIFSLISTGTKFHFLKKFSFEDRLADILADQRKLRKRLQKGYLTTQQFEQLNKPLQEKINKLLSERRKLSANYIELDLNQSKLFAFEKALRDLKAQLNKKQITQEDYKTNSDFYKKRIALLKHEIVEQSKEIDSEKKNAEKEFEEKPKKRPKKKTKPKTKQSLKSPQKKEKSP